MTLSTDTGGGFGNEIIIQHDSNYLSLYGHLSEILVNKGDTVKQGQLIGKTGNSGRSTGPHLHFTIKEDGKAVDPVQYLSMPKGWFYDE